MAIFTSLSKRIKHPLDLFIYIDENFIRKDIQKEFGFL